MKILFVVTRNPDECGQADQFTTYKAIEFLRDLGHNVDVFVLEKNKILSVNFFFKCIIGIFKLEPFQVNLYRNSLNDERFKKLIKKHSYDRFYIHLIRGLSLMHLMPKNNLYLGMQLSQGLNFMRISKELPFGVKKILYRIESILCKFYEKNVLKHVHKANFVGTQDPEFLDISSAHEKFTIIPHGVNVEYSKKTYSGKELIFLANFASEANQAAFYLLVSEIMPKVLKVLPATKLTICGMNMPLKFYKYSSDNIFIKGSVSCHLSEISSHKIFLNPVRAAAGMQNKALAGFIAGVPVVTFKSAIAGMSLNYPTCHSVHSSSQEFAKVICIILNSYPKLEELELVSKRVKKEWSWDSLHKKWANSFLDV